MEKSASLRNARWLRYLVTAAFVCVILAMVIAPVPAAWIRGGLGVISFEPEDAFEVTPGVVAFFLGMLCLTAHLWIPILWILVLIAGDWAWLTLTLFLLAVDILLAVNLWRLRRRLDQSDRDVLLKK